jgi:hypothetical protein
MMKRLTFEDLLKGNVNPPLSFINEPSVEEPKAESAAERARRLWFNRPEEVEND